MFGDWRSGIAETFVAVEPHKHTPAQRTEWARLVALAKAEREELQRRQWSENAKKNGRLWAACRPIADGDAAAQYLRRRGFAGLPWPDCLRSHHRLPYYVGGTFIDYFAAMVAPVVDPTDRVVALHRTYLNDDGTKAEVSSVRKLTPAAGRLADACIPLAMPQRGCIGIAEGIETALAARSVSGVPTVAAYSAGNLAAWRWPAGTLRMVIFADADPVGRRAADTLRARAVAAGMSVKVLTPSREGDDWADVWVARTGRDDPAQRSGAAS